MVLCEFRINNPKPVFCVIEFIRHVSSSFTIQMELIYKSKWKRKKKKITNKKIKN